jgi:hypothetical protein
MSRSKTSNAQKRSEVEQMVRTLQQKAKEEKVVNS